MKRFLITLSVATLFFNMVKAQDCTGLVQWSASESYATANTKVVHLGVLYHSNFWTSNEDPAANNGVAGSGQPWTSEGACLAGTEGTASTSIDCSGLLIWDAEKVYVSNDRVVKGSDVYKAKWWTQGNDPETNEGTSPAAFWIKEGPCTSGTVPLPPVVSPVWNTDGNNISTGQFIGTTNSKALILKANNLEGLTVNPEKGSVSIGKALYPTYYKFEVNEGLSAFTGPNQANQNNLLVLYSGNKATTRYGQGFRHYIGFSHALFANGEEYGIMNVFDYNAGNGQGLGKHLLVQNTAQGNLGIGMLSSAPTEKLHVAGQVRWGNNILALDQGGSIELGASNGSVGSGVPFIDFHGNGSGTDFNARIINDENQTLSIIGNLKVKGNGLVAKQICVNATYSWCDYVFEQDYKLMSLKDLKTFVNRYHHLPEVPSAKEIEQEGLNLNLLTTLHMKKIEELTLYTIEQEQKIEALEERLKKLEMLIENK